ncbi:hypothetical protein, conserved [Eimeria acervulina]|uniref:Uncharacterized protein n=1 Tax=Eimeria acervulina TaxID=5801 RepID=U6GJH6_EIMAC|nr:hypothetical protein, conserved [Eimeria acervulina]CDI78744.1 hypothetical protein, conserved [Eimeria acervulina]
MANLRQRLSEQQPQQQQPQQQQEQQHPQQQPQQQHKQQQKDIACSLNSEDVPLYIAVSGGDASVSLLHLAAESVEKRLSRRLLQQQKGGGLTRPRDGAEGEKVGAGRNERGFNACIALHVDIQRLLRPPAAVVTARVAGESCCCASGVQTSAAAGAAAAAAEDSGVVLQGLAPHEGDSLAFQVQKAATDVGPHVQCVLLHPLGFSFSYVLAKQQEGREAAAAATAAAAPVEVYRHPDGRPWGREELERMQQQEERMRRLLAETFAVDKTAAERLTRALVAKVLRGYFERMQQDLRCTYTPYLCTGDTASAAALSVLERLSYGEGRCLGLETSAIDGR